MKALSAETVIGQIGKARRRGARSSVPAEIFHTRLVRCSAAVVEYRRLHDDPQRVRHGDGVAPLDEGCSSQPGVTYASAD
ncbi:hypothetical protein OV450_3724 [Actinobacteria bacterium OV450]|nr:hypothetical protein OV450_3724 [Actinobacteria bacterium OV450]